MHDGDVLVFVDADVNMPDTLLDAIHEAMSDPACVGGGVDVDYRPKRLSMRLYLRAWRLLGRLSGMAQGATQFCRKSVFEQVGGYDEKAWIGEDVDFYWSLKRYAKRTDGVRPVYTAPSCATVQPSLRQVALVENSGLDQPPLHIVIPPPEAVLGGLAFRCSSIDPRLPPSWNAFTGKHVAASVPQSWLANLPLWPTHR